MCTHVGYVAVNRSKGNKKMALQFAKFDSNKTKRFQRRKELV